MVQVRSDEIKQRIRARLDALGISQFEAAELTGRGRHYIYDILKGKKKMVRDDGLADLSRGLSCSVDYLLSKSDEVGKPVPLPSQEVQSIPFAGVIEAGSFRLAAAKPPAHPPLGADPRYPSENQVAFLYRGDPVEGIDDGMYVVAVDAVRHGVGDGGVKPGATVVLERFRMLDGELRVERTIRKLTASLPDKRLSETLGSQRKANEETDRVVGVVIAAYRLL